MTPHTRGQRVSALRALLGDMRSAIPIVRNLDPDLGDRLSHRLDRLIGPTDRKLAAVEDGGSTDPAADEAAGEYLLEEWLAFLAAASIRRANLDGGVSRLAERWLDALSRRLNLPTVAVVIPSTREFAGIVSQVVRLRLTARGVWGLPVAVHEFGHFVAAEFTRREALDGLETTVVPVERLLHEACVESPQRYDKGHELFADGWAAMVAGPAYTRYCLTYRFDAQTAQQESPSHPATVRRMRMQLAVLDRLGERDYGGFLAGAASTLRDEWTQRLATVGLGPEAARDPDLDDVEWRLIELLMTEDRFSPVRYREHGRAKRLAEIGLADSLEPWDVAHILNASWLRRRRLEVDGGPASPSASDLAAIEAAVLRLVTRVLTMGGGV